MRKIARRKSHLFIESSWQYSINCHCHAYGSSHIFRYFTMFISFYYQSLSVRHTYFGVDLEKESFILSFFAPYFYPIVRDCTFAFHTHALLPMLAGYVCVCHCSAVVGYIRCTHEPAGYRVAKCCVFNWQRAHSICFSHVYIRFNPFLCYSISVNLLSVQWQRKINVISMFYR